MSCLASKLHPPGQRETLFARPFQAQGMGRKEYGKENLVRMAGENGAFVVAELIARVVKPKRSGTLEGSLRRESCQGD